MSKIAQLYDDLFSFLAADVSKLRGCHSRSNFCHVQKVSITANKLTQSVVIIEATTHLLTSCRGILIATLDGNSLSGLACADRHDLLHLWLCRLGNKPEQDVICVYCTGVDQGWNFQIRIFVRWVNGERHMHIGLILVMSSLHQPKRRNKSTTRINFVQWVSKAWVEVIGSLLGTTSSNANRLIKTCSQSSKLSAQAPACP